MALSQPVERKWEPIKGVAGAVDDADSGLNITPHGPLGKGMQLVHLPLVAGSVRLSANVEISAADTRVELFVSDRDVGKGYRLRLDCADNGDWLALMRGDVVIKSRALGHLKRSTPGHEEPWRLSIEREDAATDATITVKLNDLPPLRFPDLVPNSGEDASGTYIAFQPGAAKVRSVLVEHKDSPEIPNLLAAGDAFAEAGKPTRAIAKYEAFLKDNPDSLLARDARLRIALCLESSGDARGALRAFLDLAQSAKDEPRYALTATFHAWSCALHLGEYEEAERLFDRVRRDYDLTMLVASIPEDTLNQLIYKYLDRAKELAATEPQRTVNLYTTAADLAAYLNRTSAVDRTSALSQGRTGAGDVLVGLGRLDEAKVLYFGVANDQSVAAPQRLMATLKVAEVERLQDRAAEAEKSYRVVAQSPDEGEIKQWALLWLGDLYLEQGDRARALETWKTSAESTSRPGLIMSLLVAGGGQVPATDDRFYANDVEYFNGRIALLAGDQKRYRDALGEVVSIGPAYDWPTPLAKHLLSLLPPAPPPADAPAPPSSTPAPAPAP
jgi:tetratricopeptide (TPR) repeat protein